jgi:CubicO group peptidase (beta-lactamase class C family)
MIAALVLAATLQQNLDAHIEQGMRDTQTRRLAVAVVKDDRVVYQRPFNADAYTRFYLASAPKPMTALAAKLTVDLDAPLTTTLTRLKLLPPLDPARMSVRDLLTHRLGFESDGVGWRTSYSGDWTDEQLFALLERHATVTPRRFRYDNLGFILATYAVEQATKEPWQTTLTSRVLAPLGMSSTNNTPCVPTKSAKTMNRGAGGVCSTTGDMTRWLRVNMTDGMLDGKRLFPLAVMREVHAPQINLQRKFGRLDRYAYGLGWYHADYRGDDVVHHFGSYPDAWAHVSWMPDRNIGVVVLGSENNPFPDSVAMLAYDTLLGREDAVSRFDAEVQEIAGFLAKIPAYVEDFAKKLTADSKDSDRALASYAGTYANEELGTLVIEADGSATIGDRASKLVRVRGDAFYARWYPKEAPERIVFSDDALTWRGRTFVRRQ